MATRTRPTRIGSLVFAALAISALVTGCGGGAHDDAAHTGTTTPSTPTSSPTPRKSVGPTNYAPPFAADWPTVTASSCQELPALADRATLVFVPELTGDCVARVPLDATVVFSARTVAMSLGDTTGTVDLDGRSAAAYEPLAGASALQAVVLTTHEPTTVVAVVRGAGSSGPRIDRLISSDT